MDNKSNDSKYSADSFISELRKIKKINESGVYSLEEYENRKLEILLDLLNKGTSQKYEDFLSDILVLKEEDILNLKEINQIKESFIYNKKIEDGTSVISSVDYNYICTNCGIEVELNENEISKNEFVCPSCSVKNYLAEVSGQKKYITKHNKSLKSIGNDTASDYVKKDKRRNKIVYILLLIALTIPSYIVIKNKINSNKASEMTRAKLEEKIREESEGNIILIDFENESGTEGKKVTNFFKATVEFKKDGWTVDDYFDRFYLSDKSSSGMSIMGIPLSYENSYGKRIVTKSVFYKKGTKVKIVGHVILIKSERSGILWEDIGKMHTHEENKSDIAPLY